MLNNSHLPDYLNYKTITVESATTTQGLVDKYPGSCPTWKAEGKCDSNTNFMSINCALSCAVTASEATATESNIASTFAPEPTSSEPTISSTETAATQELIDKNENCPAWAAMGECDANPNFMLESCALSCSSETPVSTTSTEATAANATTSTTATTTTTTTEATLATKHRSFADELTASMYTKENECSSALGVSMAFSLIYPGSTNNATDEIRDTLGYPEGSNMQLVWENTTQRMLSSSNGECICPSPDGVGCELGKPLLQIANSVWLDNNDTLNPEYELVVGDYAKQTDFDSDDSPDVINEWVSNSTNELIDGIVPEGQPLYPPIVLIAINSIYFKANWANEFEKSSTNLDTFYTSAARDTEASEAHFMNQVFEYMSYSHDALPGYQVAQLPFSESQMSMIFVLPMSDDVGPALSAELLPALNELQLGTRVAMSLPKFKFESTYDALLKAALIQTGIESPFAMGTQSLCGLLADYDCASLIIDQVIQKTIIDVNEEGVEAAAVTAIKTVGTSRPTEEPILMILDHPFQFFIYDAIEDLVLFEGRVGAPEVPDDEPVEPLLNATRSDSDFWTSNFGVDPMEPPLFVPDATSNTTDELGTPTPTSNSNPTYSPTINDEPTYRPTTDEELYRAVTSSNMAFPTSSFLCVLPSILACATLVYFW